MTTLYQLHSTMDALKSSTIEMSLSWRDGDSILLLGTTVAYIDWLNAYLADSDIEGVKAIYALADDVAQLSTHISTNISADISANTTAALNNDAKFTDILTDAEWVTLTRSEQFDKVVTISL